MKRWLVMGGAILAIVLVIAGLKAFFVFQKIQTMKAAGPPKITVSAAEARLAPWQPALSAIATLHAVHGADLSAEVSGIVDAIEFRPGEDVKAGRLLIRLRAGDDLAHLASLEATANRNQITYDRDKAQLEIQAVSQATVDASAADLATARALVNEQRAVASKKFIRAPFDGRVGIRAVDVGQYVAPGTTLVTLQSLHPIYADFYVPQQDLSRVAVGQSVSVMVVARADKPITGVIEAVDPKIDVDTRNIRVRASIPNPDFKLLPGMAVNVSVASGAPRQLITLPQSAVVYNPYGASVYIVGTGPGDSARRVQQRFIGPGETRGDQVAVLSGIKPGEWVVTSGQLKLKNGDRVVINNAVTPSNDPQPNPHEQ